MSAPKTGNGQGVFGRTARRRRLQPVPDATFPGYVEVSKIGGGAFGNVYRATELDTGRPVALKVLEAISAGQ